MLASLVVAVVPHLAVYGAVGRARRLVKALIDTLPASQHKKVILLTLTVSLEYAHII